MPVNLNQQTSDMLAVTTEKSTKCEFPDIEGNKIPGQLPANCGGNLSAKCTALTSCAKYWREILSSAQDSEAEHQ